MNFVKRLIYYLSGVGIGIVLLMFFLSGKKTSCDYGPNARTLKFLKNKPLQQNNSIKDLAFYQLDSIDIVQVLDEGEVNFRNSEISKELPNIYSVEHMIEKKGYFEFRFRVDQNSTRLISIKPINP